MEVSQIAADVLSEFLEVAIHNILYVCNVYPAAAFERRRKYNVPVQMAVHPAIRSYIGNSMETIHKLLQKNEIDKVVITILNKELKPVEHFVFEINIPLEKEMKEDASLLDVEMALRALCLKISTSDGVLKLPSGDCTFSIHIHTKEITAVELALSEDESLQAFPWIEGEPDRCDLENGSIVPLKSINTQIGKMQLYVIEKRS